MPCFNALLLQDTRFVHPLQDVQLVNAIVNHVTVGRAKTVAHLRTMSTQRDCRLLHLLEGARARSMGFGISDDSKNRKPLSVFQVQLQNAFLKDYQYLTLTVMGAVAEAISANIVFWLPHA